MEIQYGDQENQFGDQINVDYSMLYLCTLNYHNNVETALKAVADQAQQQSDDAYNLLSQLHVLLPKDNKFCNDNNKCTSFCRNCNGASSMLKVGGSSVASTIDNYCTTLIPISSCIRVP